MTRRPQASGEPSRIQLGSSMRLLGWITPSRSGSSGSQMAMALAREVAPPVIEIQTAIACAFQPAGHHRLGRATKPYPDVKFIRSEPDCCWSEVILHRCSFLADRLGKQAQFGVLLEAMLIVSHSADLLLRCGASCPETHPSGSRVPPRPVFAQYD